MLLARSLPSIPCLACRYPRGRTIAPCLRSGGLAGLLIPLGVPRIAFDVLAPLGKLVFPLSQFNELDPQKGGRACSPAADLPAWWNKRSSLGVNIRR